jgi:hypothetical protein
MTPENNGRIEAAPPVHNDEPCEGSAGCGLLPRMTTEKSALRITYDFFRTFDWGGEGWYKQEERDLRGEGYGANQGSGSRSEQYGEACSGPGSAD